MNIDDLKTKLHEHGVNPIDGKGTEVGTYSVRVKRENLWSGANRLNSGWIRAELIIVDDFNSSIKSDDDCIEQWKTMKIESGQKLLLKTGADKWKLFDKDGALIGDETAFISKYEKPSEEMPEQIIYFGAPGTGKSHSVNEIVSKHSFDVKNLSPAERVLSYTRFLITRGYKSKGGKLSNPYPSVLTRKDDVAMANSILGATYNTISEITSVEEISKVIDYLENNVAGISYNKSRSSKAPSAALKQYRDFLSQISSKNVFRVTFHPESDYSSFVGCYKPSMKGKDIVYDYTPQAFTEAYIFAWQNPSVPTFLIIEEINRGNCAAIFGDLFQLLDRKNGKSEYPVRAEKDLADYLSGRLAEKGSDGIKDGLLSLPKNLRIIATMNTSDQGLFPMDSAFKRRWEWKYVPIMKGETVYTIDLDSTFSKDWWDFVLKVNERIESVTLSSDKKIGYWFVKPDKVTIDTDLFVSKVVSYLWNDIFKNVNKKNKDNVFLFSEGSDPVSHTFDSFFNENGTIDTEMVKSFIQGVLKESTSVGDTSGTGDNTE